MKQKPNELSSNIDRKTWLLPKAKKTAKMATKENDITFFILHLNF